MKKRGAAGKRPFTPDTRIDEALAQGPNVVAVFLRYRMYCIGCVFARFETLYAAAVNHQVDLETFLEDLNAAAK